MTTDIIKAYEAVLLANQYESDSAQRQAIAALSDLAEALEAARSAKPNPMLFWRPKKRPSVRGLYLWGGVGSRQNVFDGFCFSRRLPSLRRSGFTFTGL